MSTLTSPRTVTKRELNQHTAQVLGAVTPEHPIIVKERGGRSWRITVDKDEPHGIDRLAREGRYTPPAVNPAPWPQHPGGPRYTSAEAQALIDDIRGDH